MRFICVLLKNVILAEAAGGKQFTVYSFTESRLMLAASVRVAISLFRSLDKSASL